MSAIASFYLVSNDNLARLKELATQPAARVSADPYWEFLFENARELEQYKWSGYVIGSEVYFYLKSRVGELDEFCDTELTDYFCQARGSSIFVFRPEAATRLAQLIASNWPDESSLAVFLNSPEMTSPNQEVVPLEAVFDGLEILKSWLAQVDATHVGLLTIG
jgi:hypothetical protein